jgi:uncharacterized membrane protein YhhN
MITMNQVESEQHSHTYGAVRIVFGAALLVLGLLMAVMALMPSSAVSPMMVYGVAVTYMAVGAGMLARQGWSRWGFYILAGMTVLGAGEAALRAHVLERSVAWDRPLALGVGLFFAWGLWMLSRPAAKAEWRGKG